jgi:transposase
MSLSDDALEWRRERDRRESPKRDLEPERKALIRDFIGEALEPAANELDSVLLSLDNGDDIGSAYHFRRLVAAVKAAAGGFRGLAE